MAVTLNRTKAVERLIELPQCKPYDLNQVLPIVCRHGHLRLAKTLLDKCPKAHFTRPLIKSPLWVAVKKGNAKLVDTILPYLPRKLIVAAKNINVAIKKGFLGIADVLLLAGSVVACNIRCGKWFNCNFSFNKIGADINEAELDNYSPLNWAVLNDREDVVKWLVARGAHLGEQEGGTPLNNAAWSANHAMVLLLLELNADPNLFGSSVSLRICVVPAYP